MLITYYTNVDSGRSSARQRAVRPLAGLILLMLSFWIQSLAALGIGNPMGIGHPKGTVYINRPLSIELPLHGMPEDWEDVRVINAPRKEYDRQQIPFTAPHEQLSFQIVGPREAPRLRVETDDPVREPAFSFILVLVGPEGGRMRRTVHILLDPAPLIDQPTVTRLPDDAERYGPVPHGKVLGGIAAETKPEGMSLHTAMVALHQANPDAFINGDMNRLRSGAMLWLPYGPHPLPEGGKEAPPERKIEAEAVGPEPKAEVVAEQPPAEKREGDKDEPRLILLPSSLEQELAASQAQGQHSPLAQGVAQLSAQVGRLTELNQSLQTRMALLEGTVVKQLEEMKVLQAGIMQLTDQAVRQAKAPEAVAEEAAGGQAVVVSPTLPSIATGQEWLPWAMLALLIIVSALAAAVLLILFQTRRRYASAQTGYSSDLVSEWVGSSVEGPLNSHALAEEADKPSVTDKRDADRPETPPFKDDSALLKETKMTEWSGYDEQQPTNHSSPQAEVTQDDDEEEKPQPAKESTSHEDGYEAQDDELPGLESITSPGPETDEPDRDDDLLLPMESEQLQKLVELADGLHLDDLEHMQPPAAEDFSEEDALFNEKDAVLIDEIEQGLSRDEDMDGELFQREETTLEEDLMEIEYEEQIPEVSLEGLEDLIADIDASNQPQGGTTDRGDPGVRPVILNLVSQSEPLQAKAPVEEEEDQLEMISVDELEEDIDKLLQELDASKLELIDGEEDEGLLDGESLLVDEYHINLDIAASYIELGDYKSATELLLEVIDQGSAEQTAEAEALMARMG